MYLNYKNEIDKFESSNFLQCRIESMNAIKQEFLKRFYKPLYLPLLSLISCLLILKSKENDDFDKIKTYLNNEVATLIGSRNPLRSQSEAYYGERIANSLSRPLAQKTRQNEEIDNS